MKRGSRNEKSKTVSAPPKQAVAIKQMTMTPLNFGEVVFGGNLKKNLEVEAQMTMSVRKQKA